MSDAAQRVRTAEPEPVPAEIRAVIQAMLSLDLGHEVRIRSVKLLGKGKLSRSTTWAAQGRNAQQASHNQRAGHR
jgi:hypothetical protein